MKRTLIMTLVAATFALPVVAIAGGNKDKSASAGETSATYSAQSEAFKSADKNADGFLTTEELAGTAHAANFGSLDLNGDGKLSQREYAHTKQAASSKDQLAIQPTAKPDGMTATKPTDASVGLK